MSKKSKPTTGHTARAMFESLEDRRMLSTVTSMSLSSNADVSIATASSVLGQNVTFTAEVLPVKLRQTKPTGFVKFFDGTTLLAKVNVSEVINSNTGPDFGATYSVYNLGKGPHVIMAKYTGDSLYNNTGSNHDTLNITRGPVVTTGDGLKYDTVTPGSGTPAALGDDLYVDYTLFNPDGSFNQTSLGSMPFNIASLGSGTIQGFTEGIEGMLPDSVRVLVVPAALGYMSSPPSNGQNITFIVHLLGPQLIVNGENSIPLTSNEGTIVAAGTDFGNVPVNTSAPATTIGLTSNSVSGLAFNKTPGIVVAGANPSQFSVTQFSNGTFTIDFHPTTAGLQQATIKIFTTDVENPIFRIQVQGVGV
jgi:hypothetical protein